MASHKLTEPESGGWTLALAVGLLAGAALAYEVLLVRLFAIVQWHHFAAMVISLALLGFGASGTLVALLRDPLLRRFDIAFPVAALAFAVGAPLMFQLAQRVPVDALELLWSPRQWLLLAAVYLLLALPFLAAATAVCLALARPGAPIHRLYGADLLGSGVCALASVLLLGWMPPWPALLVVAGAAAVAAGIGALASGRGIALLACALLGLLLLPGLPRDWGELRMSQYKALSTLLRVPGTHVVAERSSPLGQLTVVSSMEVPLRHAPGLSLASRQPLPDQLALFVDGDGPTAINRYAYDLAPLGYLGDAPEALPYALLDAPRVLVLGAGGGGEVLRALWHGAAAVDAVEIDPRVVELVNQPLADFSGALYRHPRVTVHVAEARAFVARDRGRYDLVQVALLDGFGAAAAGLHALDAGYIYTVEAFGDYLGRLADGGLLAVTRWNRLPPRDSLRLVATARAALERAGIADPAQHVVLLRGWNTHTLLVRATPFTADDLVAVRRFAAARAFDLAWLPGMARDEANRHNVLDTPAFHDGAHALLGDGAGRFLADYKFDITPATDDRPHFFQFVRPGTLPELYRLRGAGGLALVDRGYPMLLAALLQALLLGGVLILLPLRVLRRRQGGGTWRARPWTVFAYFGAVGLAFMALEMAFIQKLVLFLGHPVHAVAVALAGFLVAAGIGSASTERLLARYGETAVRHGVLVAIALLGIGYLVLLPGLFAQLLGWPEPARVAVALALIAPLGACMGLPLPLGLRRLAAKAPEAVPWAWGINGCASVVGAVLAALLALHFGFAAVVLIAVWLYLLTAVCAP
jgi:hypothetical protein